MKIVIIDDEQPILEVYSKELEHVGFDVFTAENAEDGFDLVLTEKPEILLLDIMLPGQSGLELLKQIKNDERTKDTKVVMLTNLDAVAVIDEGYELGADAYFVKAEFVPSQIADEIQNLIKKTDTK